MEGAGSAPRRGGLDERVELSALAVESYEVPLAALRGEQSVGSRVASAARACRDATCRGQALGGPPLSRFEPRIHYGVAHHATIPLPANRPADDVAGRQQVLPPVGLNQQKGSNQKATSTTASPAAHSTTTAI